MPNSQGQTYQQFNPLATDLALSTAKFLTTPQLPVPSWMQPNLTPQYTPHPVIPRGYLPWGPNGQPATQGSKNIKTGAINTWNITPAIGPAKANPGTKAANAATGAVAKLPGVKNDTQDILPPGELPASNWNNGGGGYYTYPNYPGYSYPGYGDTGYTYPDYSYPDSPTYGPNATAAYAWMSKLLNWNVNR
jgi:hypothetical protein